MLMTPAGLRPNSPAPPAAAIAPAGRLKRQLVPTQGQAAANKRPAFLLLVVAACSGACMAPEMGHCNNPTLILIPTLGSGWRARRSRSLIGVEKGSVDDRLVVKLQQDRMGGGMGEVRHWAPFDYHTDSAGKWLPGGVRRVPCAAGRRRERAPPGRCAGLCSATIRQHE
jgi:hypothetical protein